MADYSPLSITENDIRSFVTPPLDYNDVSTAEILGKIKAVETYVKYAFFDGGSIPTDGGVGVTLLVISSLISNPSLAKKYRTLASETLGDYSYSVSQPMARGSVMQSDPFAISKTWHQMGLDILSQLSADTKYKIFKTND